MKTRNIIFTILFIFTSTVYLFSQGCSDAGFCTIGSFKPNEDNQEIKKRHQVKLGYSYGMADNSISIMGGYLDYKININKFFSFSTKLTLISQSSDLYSSFGLSDVYLNTNYRINDNSAFTIGFKIPLSNANNKNGALALPMDFQSSLGTFDFITGFSYSIKKIQFVLGLQQPITQNKNEFLPVLYESTSDFNSFLSTNKYIRKGDVLLRVSYPLKLSKKIILTPGVLPIYHLSNDKYTDEYNMEKEIEGSQGFTLNANIYFDYLINSENALQLNIGFPMKVRDKRPDGLTRGLIATLEYSIRF